MGDTQTVVADEAAPGREYTLVVAVANPASVDQLMRTAVDVASDHDGEIRVVSVAHKPVSSPFWLFSEGRIKRDFADEQQAVLDSAIAAAANVSVPVRRSLLVGTDVAEAILSVVRESEADAVLLGWQEDPRPSDIVLGQTVDPVVQRAPCDVFVERVGTTADGMDALLLPTEGGPHSYPATDVAGSVARANDAPVTVVCYVTPDADESDRDAAYEAADATAERLSGVTVHTCVEEATAVDDAIVTAAADHDLVVLGATRERHLRKRVVGSVAASVGQRVAPPVIIAKRNSDRSRLGRALDRWRG